MLSNMFFFGVLPFKRNYMFLNDSRLIKSSVAVDVQDR